MIPPLRLQIMAVAAAGYYYAAIFFFGNSAYNGKRHLSSYFGFILGLDGKQQFIIFAAVQCAGNRVYIKFQGHVVGVFANRYHGFVQLATYSALFAQVEDIAS